MALRGTRRRNGGFPRPSAIQDPGGRQFRWQDRRRVSMSLAAYELVNSAHPVLVGTADVVRWKSVESSMLDSVNAPPSNWGVVPAAVPSATAIRVTIDGENRPLQTRTSGHEARRHGVAGDRSRSMDAGRPVIQAAPGTAFHHDAGRRRPAGGDPAPRRGCAGEDLAGPSICSHRLLRGTPLTARFRFGAHWDFALRAGG